MAGRNSKRAFVVKEMKRQFLHLVIGLSMSLLIYFHYAPAYIPGIIAIIGFGLSVWHDKRGIPILGYFLKEVDRNDFLPGYGAISLMGGIFIAFMFFPVDFAFIAAITLSIVDSFATAFGLFLGEEGKKSVWASTTGGIINIAFFTSFFTYIPVTYAVVGTFAGAAAELFYKKWYFIDDNLIIPIVAGLVLIAVKAIFAG